MDALRQHDVESSRNTEPGEKLAQALELMSVGIRLKRAALRKALPDRSDREIDRAVEEWLLSNA